MYSLDVELRVRSDIRTLGACLAGLGLLTCPLRLAPFSVDSTNWSPFTSSHKITDDFLNSFELWYPSALEILLMAIGCRLDAFKKNSIKLNPIGSMPFDTRLMHFSIFLLTLDASWYWRSRWWFDESVCTIVTCGLITVGSFDSPADELESNVGSLRRQPSAHVHLRFHAGQSDAAATQSRRFAMTLVELSDGEQLGWRTIQVANNGSEVMATVSLRPFWSSRQMTTSRSLAHSSLSGWFSMDSSLVTPQMVGDLNLVHLVHGLHRVRKSIEERKDRNWINKLKVFYK